ncbi:MAG: ATP-binding cassette domain-containing protein [Bacilli bacterium]
MRLKNLSMSFGIQELFKNINLYIVETEKIGIVGVNDAGKTTFLKIIMGIISPDNGEEMGFIEYNRRTDLYEKSEQAITDYLYNKYIKKEEAILNK